MDEAALKEIEGKVDGLIDEGGAKLPLKSLEYGGVGVKLPPGPFPSLPELLTGHPARVEVRGAVPLIL